MKRLDRELRIRKYVLPPAVVGSVALFDELTKNTTFQYYSDPPSSNLIMVLVSIIFFVLFHNFIKIVVSIIWLKLTPIKSENVVETFLVTLLSYFLSICLVALILLKQPFWQWGSQLIWLMIVLIPVAVFGTIVEYRVIAAIDPADEHKPYEWAKEIRIKEHTIIVPTLVFATGISLVGGYPVYSTVNASLHVTLIIGAIVSLTIFVFLFLFVGLALLWGMQLSAKVYKFDRTKWAFHTSAFILGFVMFWGFVTILNLLVKLANVERRVNIMYGVDIPSTDILLLLPLGISGLIYGFLKQRQLAKERLGHTE